MGHLTSHRTPPHTKNYPTQNVNSVDTEKTRFSLTHGTVYMLINSNVIFPKIVC